MINCGGIEVGSMLLRHRNCLSLQVLQCSRHQSSCKGTSSTGSACDSALYGPSQSPSMHQGLQLHVSAGKLGTGVQAPQSAGCSNRSRPAAATTYCVCPHTTTGKYHRHNLAMASKVQLEGNAVLKFAWSIQGIQHQSIASAAAKCQSPTDPALLRG